MRMAEQKHYRPPECHSQLPEYPTQAIDQMSGFVQPGSSPPAPWMDRCYTNLHTQGPVLQQTLDPSQQPRYIQQDGYCTYAQQYPAHAEPSQAVASAASVPTTPGCMPIASTLQDGQLMPQHSFMQAMYAAPGPSTTAAYPQGNNHSHPTHGNAVLPSASFCPEHSDVVGQVAPLVKASPSSDPPAGIPLGLQPPSFAAAPAPTAQQPFGLSPPAIQPSSTITLQLLPESFQASMAAPMLPERAPVAPAPAPSVRAKPSPSNVPSAVPVAAATTFTSADAVTAEVAAVMRALEDAGAKVFFEKALTSSDASGSGRVVIPKAIAEQFFPRLEAASGAPVMAKDIKGNSYSFRFRFWINNQSRMYLLEGAGELHRNFKMRVGDIMIFAQRGDGSLVVAGRPATKADGTKRHGKSRAAAPASTVPVALGGGAAAASTRPRDPASDASAVAKMKKRRTAPSTSLNGGALSLALELDPAVDGVFRAAPAGSTQPAGSIVAARGGRWVVTLDVVGELYQAHFDSQEDALEALTATGRALPVSA